MAEYFTLDPAYGHYVDGKTELAFNTVFNERHLSRFSSVRVFVTAGLLGFAIVYVVAQLYVRGALRLGNGTSDIILLTFFVAGGGIVLVVLRQVAALLKTLRNLRLLERTGTLIDGILWSYALKTKPAYWHGDMPQQYIEVMYQFIAPNQEQLHGIQIRMLKETEQIPRNPSHMRVINAMGEDETPFWVPKQGTPIRVLYADPETYVML